jgi:hypothetical protein
MGCFEIHIVNSEIIDNFLSVATPRTRGLTPRSVGRRASVNRTAFLEEMKTKTVAMDSRNAVRRLEKKLSTALG